MKQIHSFISHSTYQLNSSFFSAIKRKIAITTLSISFFTSLLMPVIAFANEGERGNDMGLLPTWAISQLTRGGYVKTDTGISIFKNDVNAQLSLHGGWRLSQHFKLGFSLNSTVKKNNETNAKIVTIGPTLGFTGFQETLGRYSIDLTLGAAYAKNTDATDYVEPSVYLIHKIPNVSIKHMFWTTGISYQKIDGIGPNSVESHHLSNTNFKLGLVFGAY